MSASDTKLVLGTFTFAGLEVPTEISGTGNAQSLAVHKLPGGARVIDAMGVDYPPITWGGLFFGVGALDRMNALKLLCAAGQPLTLTWHTFSYTVLVRSLETDERRQYEISYRISCEVVKDNSNPQVDDLTPVLTDVMQLGLSSALIAADVINDSALNLAMINLAAQIDAIQDFSSAALSTIGLVQSALATAQGRAGVLLTLADTAIGAQPGFAGVMVGSDALTMAASLAATQAAIAQEGTLLILGNTLGVIAQNLASVNGSPNTVNVAGGNLFAISAQQYGDPTQWTAIAQANNLTDPQITGPTTLTIPLSPANNDGVLTA